MLHGLATCTTIAATPFYPNSTEGQTFVVSLYTYAHSALGGKNLFLYVSPFADVSLVALGMGLVFLKKRMDENQTTIADEASTDVEGVFTYNFFMNEAWE